MRNDSIQGPPHDAADRPNEVDGLHVTVDEVQFVPNADTPADRPYAFRYDLSIHNDSSETVLICGRKWVVENARGEKLVVEGDGVVGKTPKLAPGDVFSYHSYHLVDTDSVAQGAYFGLTVDGRRVFTRIPQFAMRLDRD